MKVELKVISVKVTTRNRRISKLNALSFGLVSSPLDSIESFAATFHWMRHRIPIWFLQAVPEATSVVLCYEVKAHLHYLELLLHRQTY